MAVDGYLNFDTQIDTKGFNNGTKQITNGLAGMKSAFSKFGKAIGATLAVSSLINFGKQAISVASDIQEVQNVVDVSFGSMSSKMEEFADKSIEMYGISKLTAKQTGSTYMAMAKAMGIVDDMASDMALSLTGLSADMASFYNKSQDITATALDSVFTGETETLKQFGIVMTEANLEAFALSQGITKSVSAMTQAEKVQLRYAYVMEQTALAQGDFARTSDGWANQTRILSEQWKEFSGIIGQVLVQTILPAVRVLNQAMSKLISTAEGIRDALAAIFGWELEESKSATSGITDMSDALGDSVANQEALTDAVNETSEAYKKQLMSFDKINKLSSETDLSDDSGIFDNLSNLSSLYQVKITADTSEAEKSLTNFQQKIKKVAASFALSFKDVFVEWDNLTGEQIAQKIVTGLSALAGGSIGFGLGGLKGAAIGATIGASLGMVMDALTFDHDGKLSSDEIVNMIVLALGAMAGAGIGFALGGPGGAAIGLSLGLGVSLLANTMIDWETLGKDVKENWKKFWNTVSELFEDAKEDTGRLINGIFDWLRTLFQKLKQWFVNKGAEFQKAWKKLISVVKDKTAQMKAKIATNRAEFKKSWEERVNLVKDKTAKIKLSFAQKVSDIRVASQERCSAITNAFSKIPEWFRERFLKVKDVFIYTWDAIVVAVKSPINLIINLINGLICAIQNGLNWIIGGLNAISFSLPDWLGGQTFGLNIGYVNIPQIPYLAQGMVVPANYGEFLAVLGDNKKDTEVVSPLSTIKQAVAEVIGSGGNEQQVIVLTLDGEVVFKKMIEKTKRYKQAMGVNPLGV